MPYKTGKTPSPRATLASGKKEMALPRESKSGREANRTRIDQKIRGEIAALENSGRGDEIHGTVTIEYSAESVKQASLLPWLSTRDLAVEWKKV